MYNIFCFLKESCLHRTLLKFSVDQQHKRQIYQLLQRGKKKKNASDFEGQVLVRKKGVPEAKRYSSSKRSYLLSCISVIYKLFSLDDFFFLNKCPQRLMVLYIQTSGAQLNSCMQKHPQVCFLWQPAPSVLPRSAGARGLQHLQNQIFKIAGTNSHNQNTQSIMSNNKKGSGSKSLIHHYNMAVKPQSFSENQKLKASVTQ